MYSSQKQTGLWRDFMHTLRRLIVSGIIVFGTTLQIAARQTQSSADLTILDLVTLQQRAQSGDPLAETELGDRYFRATGGASSDYPAALDLFTKAAAQNIPKAQNGLGNLYLNGNGVPRDYAQALSWYQKAADQNYPGAQFNLGRLYQFGWGVTKDFAQAFSWYQKAALQGNALAQNSIGNLYLYGNGVTRDYAQALSWYQKAADQNNAQAQFNLGRIYENGWGVTRDYTQAAAWYQKSANQGNSNAQVDLGALYELGHGFPKSFTDAATWYRKAADQGNTNAQVDLGALYEYARGVDRDYAQAASWYRKAADHSSALGQYYLGLLYKNGRGFTQDDAQAAGWFRKAADQGNPDAQLELGFLYDRGSGVPKDEAQAAVWYRKAADQGNRIAQFNLGYDYNHGEGVTIDDEQAAIWYRKSAEQGYAKAQDKLGLLYKWGQGVSTDSDQARFWLQKAADQGDTEAKTYLAQLTGPTRHPDAPENYLGPPNHLFPMLISLDKNLQNSYKTCVTTPKNLDDKTRAKIVAACNNLAVYYTTENLDTAAALTAYQESCDLGDAKNCQTLGITLFKKGDPTSARLVWSQAPACMDNNECKRLLFFSFRNEGNGATPNTAGMEQYGRPLCEHDLQMDVCQTMTAAGLTVDMAAIAARKRQLQIDDLKNRINGLEADAQDNDNNATQLEVRVNASSGGALVAALDAIASSTAQSDRNTAANDRAQAQQLRDQLIALQGSDSGAQAKGESFFSKLGGVVEAVQTALQTNSPNNNSGSGSAAAKTAACSNDPTYTSNMNSCRNNISQAPCYRAAAALCECYMRADPTNPSYSEWASCAATNTKQANDLNSNAPVAAH